MSEPTEGKNVSAPMPLAPTDLKDVVNKTHRKPGAEHFTPGLKRVPMYWHPYRTMAKQRWWGREILELVSTEFRDRSIEYYRYALESGVVTINGVIAKPGTIVKNGDRIENMVHRHEIPVTSTPVKLLHRDDEHGFIVIDKPGSIPVHATGRYFKNSLVEILKRDFGIPIPLAVNRLDRLTSGCMIIALTPERARLLCNEFVGGIVRKEYIARCLGEFPAEEVVVEQPLLCVDRQMGLNIVHPEGKYARTIFNRLFYDPVSNTSVLHCQPLTGRSHQIRVHLQFIGHSIANDPVYQNVRVWGPKGGKGGVSIEPSSERRAPLPPTNSQFKLPEISPESFSARKGVEGIAESLAAVSLDGTALSTPASRTPLPTPTPTPLPREIGTDIGMSSPVPLSAEAVGIITRLRNQKDESEDWGRWRDVIFRAKKALNPVVEREWERAKAGGDNAGASKPERVKEMTSFTEEQLQSEDKLPDEVSVAEDGSLYCTECYLPLRPDPKPESLYIFLHALRYTTSQWSFETEMPFWAHEGEIYPFEVLATALSTGFPSPSSSPSSSLAMGFKFGSFDDICLTASLVICPLVGESQGIEPTCYSRNVEINNTLIFQPGRKEIVHFFYMYMIIELLAFFLDSAIIPTASNVYPWFTAIYSGLVTATYACLMINGFVGFQFAEDGTPTSLWGLRIACLIFFGLSFFVSIATFKGFAGFSYTKPVGLYIVYLLWPVLCVVVYIVLQFILVLRTLDDRWPIGDIVGTSQPAPADHLLTRSSQVFGASFFAVAQILLFAFSVTICDAVQHYIDGLFFYTLCMLLSVMMVYKYWDSITKEDLEFSVGSKQSVWEIKDPLLAPENNDYGVDDSKSAYGGPGSMYQGHPGSLVGGVSGQQYYGGGHGYPPQGYGH
ncbi:Chitin synthase export chaperone [Ceratobasidium theobromae]|uniref:Chitin synthase export chaperone n=1 Tax=Ceratobasidium theobromae TaxID=1582974 RepID=A0A5N5QP84_9AGAM|nr:Chitin synthase export chaperone [Ceratobasidium theobromae]